MTGALQCAAGGAVTLLALYLIRREMRIGRNRRRELAEARVYLDRLLEVNALERAWADVDGTAAVAAHEEWTEEVGRR